jgi:prepilin peptidase CpaA
MLEKYFLIGAVLVACIGAITDVRGGRIPNRLTYSAIGCSLLLRFAVLGWSGLKSGLFAALIAGLILSLFFVIRAMGGGDLKLMSAVAAWTGVERTGSVLLAAALAGGLLAILYMAFGQSIRGTFKNVFTLTYYRIRSGLRPHPVFNIDNPKALRVPFGVAIAMGTLFCACNAIWWR